MNRLLSASVQYRFAVLFLAVQITMIGLAVAALPSLAAAQTSEIECQTAGGQWLPTTDGTGQVSFSCQMAGTSQTQGITDNQNASQKSTASCESWTGFFTSPITCFGRTIGSVIASFLITVSAKLLELSGLLFNYLVYYTIIAFGDATNGFLSQQFLNAINQVWTVFRDFANIGIIGLFTFIAIATILGAAEYGAKKMLSRVLIVAVLINFSLLFTKIIIDSSNFVAYQFYKASGVIAAPSSSSVSAAASTSFTQDGIAGSFVRYMGVTSIGDTYKALSAGADKIDSGALAFAHGLFSAILLLAAAGVLFYGSFLVLSRAILLVLLLVTSAFAFMTYLLPKFAESQYGWTAWWKALLKSAVFAPLLMLLLWASLVMAAATAPRGGTLGGLLADPQNAGNVGALFSYIFVLGILFASFKIASKFSTKIGGVVIEQLPIVLPAALAARNLIAPMLRQKYGRNSAITAARLGDDIKAERAAAAQAHLDKKPFDYSKLVDLQHKKAEAEAKAKRTYDLVNTKPAQAIVKQAGLGDQFKKKEGGYLDSAKKVAAEAAKAAAGSQLSKDEVNKRAEDIVTKERSAQTAQLAEQKKLAEQQVDAVRQIAEQQQSAFKTEHEAAKQTLEAVTEQKTRTEQNLSAIEKEIQRNAAEEKDPAKKEDTAMHLQQQKAQHQRDLSEQEERIKHAHAEVKRTGTVVDAKKIEFDKQITQAEAERDKAGEALADHEKRLKKAINDYAKKLNEANAETTGDIAAYLADKETHGDSFVSMMARSQGKKESKPQRVADIFKKFAEQQSKPAAQETPTEKH